MVDFLSSLAILFSLATSDRDSRDLMAPRPALTTIHGLLPGFQLALYSWLCTKVDIRRIFLQNSLLPFSISLLSSSPWTASLLPEEVVTPMTLSPVLQGQSQLSFTWVAPLLQQFDQEAPEGR